MLHLVSYDRAYLDRSFDWLSDPETRALTLTPAFSRADQEAFFERLPTRDDYKVWGVATEDDSPVGAAGIKAIAGTRGEYWGYIGDKALWGRGLGTHLLAAVEMKARELGLDTLELKVSMTNDRAIRLYHRAGYVDREIDGDVIWMEKAL